MKALVSCGSRAVRVAFLAVRHRRSASPRAACRSLAMSSSRASRASRQEPPYGSEGVFWQCTGSLLFAAFRRFDLRLCQRTFVSRLHTISLYAAGAIGVDVPARTPQTDSVESMQPFRIQVRFAVNCELPSVKAEAWKFMRYQIQQVRHGCAVVHAALTHPQSCRRSAPVH